MRWNTLAIIAAVAISVAGCQTTGKSYSTDSLPTVTVNKSLSDVQNSVANAFAADSFQVKQRTTSRMVLEKPLPKGTAAWDYYSSLSRNTPTSRLVVRFDRRGAGTQVRVNHLVIVNQGIIGEDSVSTISTGEGGRIQRVLNRL